MRLLIIIGLCFTLITDIKAQNVFSMNRPGCNCYSELIFENSAINPKAVLVLDAGKLDLKAFASDNKFKASSSLSDFNFLYVSIQNKGSAEEIDCYRQLTRTISSADKIDENVFFLVQSFGDDSLQVQKLMTKIGSTSNKPVFVSDFDSLESYIKKSTELYEYIIPDRYLSYDAEYKKRMYNYTNNFDVGFFYAPVFSLNNKALTDKLVYGVYGLSFTKNLNNFEAFTFKFGASLQIPNQRTMQSEMQSKMMSAMQNGDDYIYINKTLSGHVAYQAEVKYTRSFNRKELFRPFLAAGLGIGSYSVMSGTLIDTIDVSEINMNNMSSMQDMLSTDDLASAMSQKGSSYLTPLAEIGFEYRLAPVSKILISLPVNYFRNLNRNEQATITCGLNCELKITINSRKVAKK